jgi:tetratricopeptide (TPR) repeat protein
MKADFLIIPLVFLLSCRPAAEEQNAGNSMPAPEPEAIAFDGSPLFPPPEPEASLRRKDSLRQVAMSNYDSDPNNLENIIWVGRRTAYLSRFKEAIAVYTMGMQQFPQSPELFRHRGHRYISTRRLDEAISDLERAAALASGRPIEIEPDGIPNKLNQPLSSLQFNIYYHWALAWYLKGDFQKAADLFEQCMHYSTNPDLLVATTDWLYMSYRRLGETQKAEALLERITPDMEIIENESYFKRLLMYKGLIQPEELLDLDSSDPDRLLDIVTQGYGVGNWYLYNGDKTRALEIFEKIIQTGNWPAFGYIAAEAELAVAVGSLSRQ